MTKKLICALLLVTSLAVTGCGLGRGDKKKDRAPLKEKNEQQASGEDESRDSNDGDNKKKTKKDRNAEIHYTYQNHPLEATYKNQTFTLGSYYTMELDEEAADEYPELDVLINKYNSKTGKEVKEFVSGSKPELIEMWNEGFTGYYEEDFFLYPVRSDNKVFSFVEEIYEFYGGAHGSTLFVGYNYDPATGREIEFDDIVKDTSKLPEIIVDDLIDQNPDLKDYFDEMTSDKEALISGIPARLDENAKGLAWALDYDGIRINFEDYAMGSYAAGARSVKISFKDHPEIFTDNYDDYKDRRVPDIGDIAVKKEDADKIVSENETEGSTETEKSVAVDIIELTDEDQYRLNLFISNFAEQGFYFYDENDVDVSALAEFAYLWSKINSYSDIETEDSYYKLSLKKVRAVTEKYFDIKLTDEDLYDHDWDKSMYGAFCRKGYYYVPAADGESYTTLAVIEQAEDAGDGTLWLYFTTYDLDLDIYRDSGEEIPKKYYTMNKKEAEDSSDLSSGFQGMAIVKKDGDTLMLKYYKQY